ncbi:MAG: hypothetical protein LBT08_08785 [Synergistaceae bacterium]|nr:hypothetical protein [Synergistaceae bacterium]
MERADLGLGAESYDVDLAGMFMENRVGVSGQVDLKTNKVRLKEFRLSWGEMKLTLGGEITPSLDVMCNVNNLDIDRLAELIPSVRASTLSGVYSGEMRARYSALSGITAEGSVTSKKGGVWLLPFESFQSAVFYTSGDVHLSELSAKIFGGNLSGSASIRLITGRPPELDLKMSIDSLDIPKAQAVFPWLDSSSGAIDSASCDISGPIDSMSGPVILSSAKLSLAGFDFSNARARIVVRDSSKLDLEFFSNTIGSPVRASGAILLLPDVDLDLGVSLSSLALDEVGKKFPELSSLALSGEGTTSLKIKGNPSKLVISGALSFPSISIQKIHSCSDVLAEFSYSNDGFSLSSAQAVWNEALITAKGNQLNNPRSSDHELNFSGTLKGLRLASLKSLAPQIKEYSLDGVVSGAWQVSGRKDQPLVEADLNASNIGILNNIDLRDAKLNAQYGNSSVSIKSASAVFAGSPVNVAGSVSIPTGDSPVAYNIKGSFQGFDPSELVRIGIVSGDISGDLTGDIRVWSDRGENPSVRVFFKDSSLNYSNVAYISDLNGMVTLSGGNLTFNKLRTKANSGYISLDGSVGNVSGAQTAPGKMPVSVKATISSADIGRLSRMFAPESKGLQGTITGNADIGGSIASPTFSGNATLSGVRAMGLFLPMVRLDNLAGDMNGIKFPNVRATVGRGFINVGGSISMGEEWRAAVKASGRSVDIRSLVFSIDDPRQDLISGSLFFDFEGEGWLDSFTGKGTAKIPSLNAMGLRLTDIQAPFWMSDGFVMVEDSSAMAYGGTVNIQVAKDLAQSNWGGKINVESADMASVIRDLMPDSEGSITGKVNLNFSVGGDTSRTSMQDGSGSLEITNGDVSGFPGVAAVSKVIGGRPLRFQSATIPFSIDGKTLYLLPGSRVQAPSEDPIFRYIMADGSIGLDDLEILLSCVGNVNIRALNAFAAGVQGVLSAAMADNNISTETILQNFLGGAITGFSKNEFKDLSFVVSGAPGDIAFNNVEITTPPKLEMMPAGLTESDNDKDKDREKGEIKIKLEFPTGPGGKKRSDNVGGQVGGQVIEQAIKNGIFSF